MDGGKTMEENTTQEIEETTEEKPATEETKKRNEAWGRWRDQSTQNILTQAIELGLGDTRVRDLLEKGISRKIDEAHNLATKKTEALTKPVLDNIDQLATTRKPASPMTGAERNIVKMIEDAAKRGDKVRENALRGMLETLRTL